MEKNNFDIEIKFVIDWDENEIVDLYKAGNWWKDKYDSSSIKNLIKGSYKFAVLVKKDEGKAIGMGRLISDGKSDAYIQDLVVLPEFRDNGIGKMLAKALLDFCISKKIVWIGLIAEPGQSAFYSGLNFDTLKDYIAMKYKNDD